MSDAEQNAALQNSSGDEQLGFNSDSMTEAFAAVRDRWETSDMVNFKEALTAFEQAVGFLEYIDTPASGADESTTESLIAYHEFMTSCFVAVIEVFLENIPGKE